MPPSPQPLLPEHLSVEPTYAIFRPTAEVTLPQAIEMIDSAIAYCRRHEIPGLLADILGLSGFDAPPSMFERFTFVTKWAESGAGRVTLAMMAPPIMVDAHKIGVTIALNRGLICDVFDSEPTAVKWLRERCLTPVDEDKPVSLI